MYKFITPVRQLRKRHLRKQTTLKETLFWAKHNRPNRHLRKHPSIWFPTELRKHVFYDFMNHEWSRMVIKIKSAISDHFSIRWATIKRLCICLSMTGIRARDYYGHIKKLDHGLPLKYLLCPFTVIVWNRGLLLNYLIWPMVFIVCSHIRFS